MALGAGIPRRLIGRLVAGDQPEPPDAGVQAVTAQHLPDAVGRDDDPAPLLAGELGRDALGTKAGMSDREADDPFPDHLRQLVGHLRPASLPGPEHLEAMPVDLALPRVVGRAVDPEQPTGLRDRRSLRLGKQLQDL
jgi:hypothetical protein